MELPCTIGRTRDLAGTLQGLAIAGTIRGVAPVARGGHIRSADGDRLSPEAPQVLQMRDYRD